MKPLACRSSRTRRSWPGSSSWGPSFRSSSLRECSRPLSRRRARPFSESWGRCTSESLLRVCVRRQQRDAQRLAHLVLDLARQFGVLAQELARVVAALADLLAVVGIPGTRFLQDMRGHAHVDDLAVAADAFAEQDVEFRRLERRRDLVLDDLHLGLVADRLLALLD